jgi:23S rRNA pseudouridine1911/1915/1917 synthase
MRSLHSSATKCVVTHAGGTGSIACATRGGSTLLPPFCDDALMFGLAGRAEQSERLDQALTREPFSLSRRGARRAIDEGRAVLNGTAIAVASRNVRPGDRLALIADEATIEILDLRPDLLVANKPAAIASQIPPRGDAPALPEVLSAQLKRSGEPPYLAVVHRLDTNTTGVIIYARTTAAAAKLTELIRHPDSSKRYLAIVAGMLREPLTIDRPIARLSEQTFGVAPDGKPARTDITPLAFGDGCTLVEATLRTGRTHQIRVHLQSAGYPVAGDPKYGGEAAALAWRPMLHALALELAGIGGWIAPIPDDFRGAAARFGIDADRSGSPRPH